MAKIIFTQKPTGGGKYLTQLVEDYGKPVLQPFEFFTLILRLYQNASAKKLYLRKKRPDRNDYNRFKTMLYHMDTVRNDRDYGKCALRILPISDCPAEDVVCLVDPMCYVSHLSAMER